MNTSDLMLIDGDGMNRHEMRSAMRAANDQIVSLATVVRQLERDIAVRDQIGKELRGFVEGVLKAHLLGNIVEIARIADAYFSSRPRYRERLEEDIEHAARKGVN